jgi:lupus La protein
MYVQVDFYFSDPNLPGDKFLYNLVGTENNPVPIKTIITFGRMKRFEPYEEIIKALKEATSIVKYVEVDGVDMVQRVRPFDPASRTPSKVDAKTLYAKGFGEEHEKTQELIEAFFEPYFHPVDTRLRRADYKRFKGSVFVEAPTEEALDAFLAVEPKPTFEGKELTFMKKLDYMEKKIEDIREGRVEPQKSWHEGGGRGRGRGRNNDRDPNDWKKRRENDQASGHRNDKGGRNGRGRGRGRGRGGGGRGGNRDNRDRNDERNRERNGDGYDS